MLDFVEEIEVSLERPGLKLEKRGFCSSGEELRWSNTAPDCGDNPINSL